MKRDNDRRSPWGRSRERGDDWGRPSLSQKRARSPKKRGRLLRWAAVAAIWIFVGLAAFVGWCAYDLPEADNIPALTRRPQVTILARDGTMFLRLGESAGPVVDAKDLPPYLIDAVVATE